MELRIEQKDNIYIISIIRSLGFSNMFDFKNRLKLLVEQGAKKIIISFKHAKYIDSSGITALISMNSFMKKNSVDFRLTDIRGPVKQIFGLAHLELFFPILDTVEMALDELGTGS